MAELSPKTLAILIRMLRAMPGWEGQVRSLNQRFWEEKLFEHEFPSWFIREAHSRGFAWGKIIPELYEGPFLRTEVLRYEPDVECKALLHGLVVLALTQMSDHPEARKLRLALQIDGLEVSRNGRLRSIEGPISVEEEKSRLLEELMQSKLGRKEIIKKHIEDAEDHFAAGKPHSAIGEARSALQAIIEEAVKLVEAKAQRQAGGGTKNQIDFLVRQKILSSDEYQAFISAWAFLSSGNHPGLPPEENGRIGTVLALEFIQIVLIKCANLL